MPDVIASDSPYSVEERDVLRQVAGILIPASEEYHVPGGRRRGDLRPHPGTRHGTRGVDQGGDRGPGGAGEGALQQGVFLN